MTTDLAAAKRAGRRGDTTACTATDRPHSAQPTPDHPHQQAPENTMTTIPEALTFQCLAETNLARCHRWHPGFPDDGWTGSDWSNAAAGEMGEACNVVKKLRRAETGTPSANDPDPEMLRVALAHEIADTVIYLDLLAQHYGIDLGAAVARKFNAVSEREEFPERLPDRTYLDVVDGGAA